MFRGVTAGHYCSHVAALAGVLQLEAPNQELASCANEQILTD